MSQGGINELQQVISDLAKAEKSTEWDIKIKMYRNSFSDMEDLKEEYPELITQIQTVKKTNLRRLLCELAQKATYLEFEIWHSFYELFFNEGSKETGEICLEKPELKKYIDKFYLMHFETFKSVPLDLQTSILLGIATKDDLVSWIQSLKKK